MIQLNELLVYKDYYRYLFECETILIEDGIAKEKATQVYSNVIGLFFIQGEDKWALDIALDCIRNFTGEEIEHILRNEKIERYHLGFGMYVRNQYIHPSKFHAYLQPDKISSKVEKFLLGIICPNLNLFSDKNPQTLSDVLVDHYVNYKGLVTETEIGTDVFMRWIDCVDELHNYALEFNRKVKDNPTDLTEYLSSDAVWNTIHKVYNEMIGMVNNGILPKSADLCWLISVYATSKSDFVDSLSIAESFRLKFEYFLAREIITQRNKSVRIIGDEMLDHKAIRSLKAKARKKKREINRRENQDETNGGESLINCYGNDILYIYKGKIRCHSNNHKIIQANAILHNKTDHEIELNVEYCTECKKFILEYTVFEQYRNRYGVLVGNFRMVVNGEFGGEYDLAEESPLMLSGYNVSQRDGYTSRERHYILARIIHDCIMDKGDVIRYLSYFIRKNGAKHGNELALSKWEEDLAFVQNYDISTQPRAIIKDVKKY